jgi:hypothetical protein
VQFVGYKLLYVYQLHVTCTTLRMKQVAKGRNTWIIFVLIRYVKIPQHLSYLSTSVARTNMYKYSASLMIQTYNIFKINVLRNDQNSKRIRKSPNISHKCVSKIVTRFKILITCRNNVLLKYERQLCKTTVARNYTEVRTVSLLGDWGAHPNTVCGTVM